MKSRKDYGEKKLLCVEDDVTEQIVLGSALLKIAPNLNIEWVESAAAAFASLKRAGARVGYNPYDLMIIDIFLDGKITGIDLWSICRNLFPNMPLIIISALPFDKFLDFQGKGMGLPPEAFHYLQKPLDLHTFQKTVFEILTQEPRVQQPPLDL